MKYELFKNLLEQSTEATSNIRATFEHGYNWKKEIDNNIANNIEKVISFLQTKVEESYFCKKNEFLMIYDSELSIGNNTNLFTLNIMVRPVEQINDLNNCTGTPLQLVVNSATGEIGNYSYGLVQLGFTELSDEEKPVIYGSYKDFTFDLNYFIKDIYNSLFLAQKAQSSLCFSYQSKDNKQLNKSIDCVTLLAAESESYLSNTGLLPLTKLDQYPNGGGKVRYCIKDFPLRFP